MLASMSTLLDGLLFAGPALALLLGFVFAFASSSSRVFARRPRQFALGVAIPMLVSAAGALRLQPVESDLFVALATGAMALAACIVGFAFAFGFGILLRLCLHWMAEKGSRHQFGDTGVSTLIARRSRDRELPAEPNVKQGE